QDRRDRGEYELEVHERRLREMERRTFGDRWDRRLSLLSDMPEHASRLAPERVEEAFAASDRGTEAHLECPQAPRDEHQAESHESEHHAVDRPALLHDAA